MSVPGTLAARARTAFQNRVHDRYRLRGAIDKLDADTDAQAIAHDLSTTEFPWAVTQSLSFALFRTYAVPSVGDLLHDTGQFTEETQKRYDDTVLLLDAPIRYGLDSEQGRGGIRRINQMHGMYDISNSDMLYVLSTFVVCPVEWINTYEWRKLTGHEIAAWTNYYRQLGRRMAIKNIPETYAGFEKFYVDYELENFAFSDKALAVADSTLNLMGTFMPFRLLPRPVVRHMSFALMDDRLLTAFGYPTPTVVERVVVRGGLKLRGLAIRLLASPRSRPLYGHDTSQVRGYRDGYRIDELGTFRSTVPRCPVPQR